MFWPDDDADRRIRREEENAEEERWRRERDGADPYRPLAPRDPDTPTPRRTDERRT